MRLALRHTVALTVRQLLALWRQPWFVVITLLQPMIWLLLFGALFKRVIEIPGFHGGSYIEFLTPGIVVMSALFSAGWHGMSIINAIDRGIMDRFLVSPVWRGALIASSLVQSAIVILVQSLIIVGVASAVGARFSAGSILLLLAVVTLLGGAICALSDALGGRCVTLGCIGERGLDTRGHVDGASRRAPAGVRRACDARVSRLSAGRVSGSLSLPGGAVVGRAARGRRDRG